MTSSLKLRKNPLSLLAMALAMCAVVSFASPAFAQEAAPPAGAAPTTTTICDDKKPCTGDGQTCESGTCVYKLTNPLGTTSIPVLVGRVVTIFTGISGSFALLMFIYGGVLWIFSGGEAERVQKGKDVMKWAVIGLLIMFGAYALVRLVFQGFGI